jgi:hypothetical protein
MSHSPSRRQIDKELARRQAEADARRAAEEQAAATYALRIIALWNARVARPRPPAFYPTFRTVLAARTTRLTYMCPACRQVGDVDLRTIDRHPDAAISSVIPALSCRQCSPNPPFARLLGLAAEGPRPR